MLARRETDDLAKFRRQYKEGDNTSPVELTDVKSITFLSGGEGCQVTFYDTGAEKDSDPFGAASVENNQNINNHRNNHHDTHIHNKDIHHHAYIRDKNVDYNSFVNNSNIHHDLDIHNTDINNIHHDLDIHNKDIH